MHPPVGRPDRLPQGRRRREPSVEELLQARKLGRQPPFSPIRPGEAWIAASRSCSRSPAAHNGGRPSSVIARRTAWQYAFARATGYSVEARLGASVVWTTMALPSWNDSKSPAFVLGRAVFAE